jgi:copper chaperone
MTTFHVPNMSCGHCRKAIEKAIGEIDGAAAVTCDLEKHLVQIKSVVPAATLAAALNHAGYSATLVFDA